MSAVRGKVAERLPVLCAAWSIPRQTAHDAIAAGKLRAIRLSDRLIVVEVAEWARWLDVHRTGSRVRP